MSEIRHKRGATFSYTGLVKLPSGTFKLTLASEVSASQVTLRAGSWMRYRSY